MRIKTIAIALISAVTFYPAQAADGLPHPVLSISANSGSAANTVLNNYTETLYTNDFTPRYAPRNEGYGFGAAVVSGDTGWSWSVNNPTNFTSTPSGTVFPNLTYPIQTQSVTTFTGDTVSAPYYNSAGGGKSFVFNDIAYHQQGQRDSDLGNLAGAYVNTGLSQASRENYARRIAIALLDWARWYPDYTLTGKNSASYINTSPTYILSADAQRASDHNGLAHEWNDTPLKAFDAIYDSDVLTNLNSEMGFDVRDYITTNVFFCEGDFFINHVPISVAIGSNLSGPYDTLPEVARVLNRPDYIVWMDQYLTAAITDNINRDGVNEEGLGYSMNYITANITAAQNTQNYFLTRPATNDQFIAISNRSVVYATSLQYGEGQWSQAALPNGQLASFGDTTFDTYFSSRNTGSSVALGAYGHVTMGAGTTSSTAVQVNQQYAGNENHMRSDTTAFTLWSFNNPYLENIRYYNGAIGRNWGEQMLEKNSVVIDRTDLTPFPVAETYGNGNLALYEPGNNGLAMTELDGYRDYSGKASRYQRLLLLNTVDLSKPYVVDVFRVTGGTNHDYTFHGAIRWTQTGQCSFPLVTNDSLYPMIEPGDPAWSLSTDTPYYGFFRGMSSNTAPGNFQMTYTDTNRATARDTKWWVTADPNVYNVYLGWTPVPARDNTVPTNFFNSLGLTRPSTVVRHRVTAGPLSDLFVSVFEPLNAGVTNIASVTRLPMNNSLESCGLQVTFKDGRVDTYIINLQNPKIAGAGGGSPTVSTLDGQYVLNGRVGLTVDRSNGDPRVWTINGTDFKYPNRELSTPTNMYYSGWVAGETRKFDGAAYDAFTTTTPLPTGTALRNKYLSFTHGKLSSGTTNISEMFKIDQVVLSNGLYHVCFTNDPMIEITNGITSVEQVAPLRTFTTSNSFEIALTAFAGQISPIADQNVPPGGSGGPLSFNFGNLGTTAGASLQVSAVSANQTLVPNSNLVIGGSGTNRTITVTTAAGQTGTAPITISTTDGIWTNSRTFNVLVGNFALTVSPPTQSVIAGNGANFTNIVTATNGTGTVSFSVSGLPAGAAANFNPATTAGAGTNVLGITTSSNSTPAGTYPLTIIATTGSQSATNNAVLVVDVIVPTPGWVTWTGGSSTGNNWSDSANWSSPLLAGNSLAFGGVTRINNTNDTAASTVYSNMVFNAGSGPFTLNGNSITLIGGITNNSAAAQTVGVGINFGNSITFNGATAPLAVTGGLTNTIGSPGSTTVTLAGTGALANLLNSVASPGGTNTLLLNGSTANWTLTDNASSAPMTVPWVFSVNSGTFNFGDSTDAPNLTLTTPNNVPSDNQVGTVAGSTGVFNMNNGTLTTSSRFNTATAANSTGIINQTGGTWNMGSQFQGANGGNAGEASIVNLSGGTLNIAGGSGTFYLASRGTGTLALSGNAVLNCGTLSVARNLVGNNVEQHGTVNLNGGILMANTVMKDASTNNSTAAFNFNGGVLQAKQNNAAFLYSTNASALVLTVQAGGAIIDDGGFAVTNPLPLRHDATLGSSPDGGLTKLDTGTLALTATNTYTGNTVVGAGTLALAGNGSISNSASISLNGSTLDASGRSDGTLTVAAAQTLSGNGTMAGNLILNGTISPGDLSAGILTNTGDITFGPGGKYIFDMADAGGQSATNWDELLAGGNFNLQATGVNPFVIQLRSIDNNANDNNPGAANFGNASSQSWPIATAAGTLAGYAANAFSVDDSGFLNDLAGGYFVVTTNGTSLLLTFIPNNPPSAGNTVLYLPPNGRLQIPLAMLAPHWGDPDGDPVQLVGVNSNSANGSNNVSSDGMYIYFTGAPNLADTITYIIGDVRTNPPAIYRPGDTQRTATGEIVLLPRPAIGGLRATGSNLVFSGAGGATNGTYYVLTSTNVGLPLNLWTIVATNVFDGNGNFSFTNSPDPSQSQLFYLLQLP